MIAIVPAYNEEVSVGNVVDTLLDADVFEDVVVVDDGSTDATAEVAEDAGATVIQTPRNLGKGGAMLYAYQSLPYTDRIGFFDADLLGFEPEHVIQLAEISDQGYDMVAGLRDKGAIKNFLQIAYSPLITGERILKRWVLDALPQTCWSGYSIETGMNDVVERNGGSTMLMIMENVSMRTKLDKTGIWTGIKGQWKMAKSIMETRKALQKSEGLSCQLKNKLLR